MGVACQVCQVRPIGCPLADSMQGRAISPTTPLRRASIKLVIVEVFGSGICQS
jgi:hypothetical protein